MIQLIEGAPEGVLAFEAVGEVDAEDYQDVLKPAIEEALAGDERLRFVFEIGPSSTGSRPAPRGTTWRWSSGTSATGSAAPWSPTSTGCEHAAKALGWLMGGRLRVFDIDELKAALEWAASDA